MKYPNSLDYEDAVASPDPAHSPDTVTHPDTLDYADPRTVDSPNTVGSPDTVERLENKDILAGNVKDIGQLPRVSVEDRERKRVDSVFKTSACLFVCLFFDCLQI